MTAEYKLVKLPKYVVLYEATILASMPWVSIGCFVDEASAIACIRSMYEARRAR